MGWDQNKSILLEGVEPNWGKDLLNWLLSNSPEDLSLKLNVFSQENILNSSYKSDQQES